MGKTVFCSAFPKLSGVRFGPVPIEEARGGISAHSHKVGARMIRKGAVLDDAAVAALREAGVEVRAFNRPRLDSPFGWLSRNHRKTVSVDGRVGFVSGLCVSDAWVGDPARGLAPWRDTGVEIRGPAVADLDAAFAQSWAEAGGDPRAALAEQAKV